MGKAALSTSDCSWYPHRENGEECLDFARLFQMTRGDRELEHQILNLFDIQMGMLLGRMGGASPRLIAAFAHTLNGSARAIGAWQVARESGVVELAVRNDMDPGPSLAGLLAAATRTHIAIADVLGRSVKIGINDTRV